MRLNPAINPHCVIDVQALLQFQSNYRSPAKPFKLVPVGFEVNFPRKVLPAGKNQ